MFSSAMLAAEDPLNANSPRNQVSVFLLDVESEIIGKLYQNIFCSVRYLITLTTSLQPFSLLNCC